MSHAEVTRTVVLTVAALGQTAFVSMYLFFPWWRSMLGRVLFSNGLVILLVLWIGIAGRLWDWRLEDATFTALYALLACVLWAQAYAYLRVYQKRAYKPTQEKVDA